MDIRIAPIFRPYLDETLVRFAYLHPEVEIVLIEDAIRIANSNASIIAEFKHTLYRQKIYRESEALRNAVIERLLR